MVFLVIVKDADGETAGGTGTMNISPLSNAGVIDGFSYDLFVCPFGDRSWPSRRDSCSDLLQQV